MSDNKERLYLSIGGLATASNVPVETLRNWERRYGFPEPVRLESGHRRYPITLVHRLQKIRKALDAGYRPSAAVLASESDLERLLREARNADPAKMGIDSDPQQLEIIEQWLGRVQVMDGSGLTREMAQAWGARGARGFLFELALPFLVEVGDRWTDGRVTIAQEHFSSEVLQAFLAERWRAMVPEGDRYPKIMIAAQEGDLHSLGIHMAAVITTVHRMVPIFLGPNTPLAQIIDAARAKQVDAVVIGVLPVNDEERSRQFLSALRNGLMGVRLAFGGDGRLKDMSGIEFIDSLEGYDHWLADF